MNFLVTLSFRTRLHLKDRLANFQKSPSLTGVGPLYDGTLKLAYFLDGNRKKLKIQLTLSISNSQGTREFVRDRERKYS